MPIPAEKRLTLVVADTSTHSLERAGAMVVDSGSLTATLAACDVERIILDGGTSAEAFLHLLASLPSQVVSDVMLVQSDGTAFLSAAGRGGDRVLYALSTADVSFYLETNGLTANRGQLALIA